jgi:hypothetical protein
MRYRSIVFLQGEETGGEMPDGSPAIVEDEALRILYGKSTKPGTEDYESIVWSGPYRSTIKRALDYLLQWDYGEPGEITAESPAGSRDDVIRTSTFDMGGDGKRHRRDFKITYNLGLSYIGLCELIPDEDE